MADEQEVEVRLEKDAKRPRIYNSFLSSAVLDELPPRTVRRLMKLKGEREKHEAAQLPDDIEQEQSSPTTATSSTDTSETSSSSSHDPEIESNEYDSYDEDEDYSDIDLSSIHLILFNPGPTGLSARRV